jgi:hypothetical protein
VKKSDSNQDKKNLLQKLSIKLPDDVDVSEMDHIKIRLLRTYYMRLMEVVQYMLPPDHRMERTLYGYDLPQHRKACLWYELIQHYKADSAINPMWTIDYVMRGKLERYGIPSAETFTDINMQGEFVKHGYSMLVNAVAGLQASVGLLSSQLLTRAYNYRVPAEHLFSTFCVDHGVDPVLQCLWLWKRNIALTQDLRQAASIAYACNPQAYSHSSFPQGWFDDRKFYDYFKVKVDGEFQPPDVSSILS